MINKGATKKMSSHSEGGIIRAKSRRLFSMGRKT
jgi:hypothetical protein